MEASWPTITVKLAHSACALQTSADLADYLTYDSQMSHLARGVGTPQKKPSAILQKPLPHSKLMGKKVFVGLSASRDDVITLFWPQQKLVSKPEAVPGGWIFPHCSCPQ